MLMNSNRSEHLARSAAALLACAALFACRDSTASTPGGGAKAPTGGLTLIEPEDPDRPLWVELGEIPLGEKREKIVKLKNIEGRPLVVQNVQAGCSCTVPSLSYVDEHGARIVGDPRSTTEVLTLPAGVVAELALRVDSRNAPTKNNDKVVEVRLVTDSATDPYFTFDAHMRVNAPFQAVPPAIDLARIAANSGGQGSTALAAIGLRGERLVDVLEAPEGVEAQLTNEQHAGGEVWILSVRVEPPLPLGYYEKPIRLRTTGLDGKGDGHPFEVPLRYYAVTDVEVMPATVLVTRAAPGAPMRGEGELYVRLPGARLLVTSHSFTGEHADAMQATISAVTPDTNGRSARWHIEITPPADLTNAPQSGVLVLDTDDPQFPRIEVPWLRRG
jgi:hypothetical protein